MSAATPQASANRSFASQVAPRPMTPTQVRTFNDLLAVGGARPTSPPGLSESLEELVRSGTAAAVERWTEKRLWISKGQLSTALRCEGELLGEANQPRRSRGMHPSTAVGIVAHRAIQIAHTHPGLSVAAYVTEALKGAAASDDFTAFWDAADIGAQSDMQMQIMTRVTSFLDSWPVLDPSWTPRFEEPVQARVGGLTLSARADLVIGRPRPEGRQTMILCDLKSGALQDHHDDEAMFYALVATLRWGIAPFRSTVYSLASGTYTDPDVTADRLHAAASQVVEAVNRYVDVLTERREPVLTTGSHCSWCPVRLACPAFLALEDDADLDPYPA